MRSSAECIPDELAIFTRHNHNHSATARNFKLSLVLVGHQILKVLKSLSGESISLLLALFSSKHTTL